MGYFRKFNRMAYDLEGNGIKTAVVNLSSSVVMSQRLIDNISVYNKVLINNGERVEQLSQRLYGTPEYYWTFILMNPKLKNIWNDWPKSNKQLQEYCINKYPGFAGIIEVDCTCNIKVGEIVYQTSDPANKGIVKCIDINNGFIAIEPINYCSTDKVNGNLNPCFDDLPDVDITCPIKTTRLDCTGTWYTSNFLDIIQESRGLDANGNEIFVDIYSDAPLNITGETSGNSVTFSSIVYHYDAPHHHVDQSTMSVISKTSTSVPISNIEFESWINDKNRTIRVIRPEIIAEIADQFEREISK